MGEVEFFEIKKKVKNYFLTIYGTQYKIGSFVDITCELQINSFYRFESITVKIVDVILQQQGLYKDEMVWKVVVSTDF